MTRTKLWAAVLTLVVCGSIAAGCGGDDNSGSDEPSQNQSQQAPGVDEEALEAGREAAERAREGDKEGALEKAREACVKQAEASLSGEAEERTVEACKKTPAE